MMIQRDEIRRVFCSLVQVAKNGYQPGESLREQTMPRMFAPPIKLAACADCDLAPEDSGVAGDILTVVVPDLDCKVVIRCIVLI